ncbi:MAG TPA: UvrB/UvrC motif-containing protein [Pseudogracilibacillus sp.]|nr:UvrB/UvrC motif-containing protein [Pseudogracilibacillus sp.]
MKCSECKERPATLHFTQIINGKKTEVQVCEICATKKGYMNYTEETYSLHDLLTGLFNIGSSQIELQNDNIFQQIEELQCSKCNITFNDFQRVGKFGCAHCYKSFKSKLDSIFRRVHSGNTKHQGKIPKRKGSHLHAKKEIELFRKRLQQLVEEEEFEKAAVVRDQIKKLEAKSEGDHS